MKKTDLRTDNPCYQNPTICVGHDKSSQNQEKIEWGLFTAEWREQMKLGTILPANSLTKMLRNNEWEKHMLKVAAKMADEMRIGTYLLFIPN